MGKKIAEKIAGLSPAAKRAYLCNLDKLLTTGYLEKYYQHLMDFDFMSAKISHSDFSVQALIEDYDLIDSVEELNSADHSEKVTILKLIQGALRLSAHVLVKDPTQLASQLWGRLQNFDMPELRSLLQQSKPDQKLWLRPLNSCLTPPNGRLLRTLAGHYGSINAIAVTPNQEKVVSGSQDGNLKVWNLVTGQELLTLPGHYDPVNTVAVTPDSKQVFSGSENGTIKVWDLDQGQELRTLTEYESAVRDLAVTSDGNWLISVTSYGVKRWHIEPTTRRSEIRRIETLMSLGGRGLIAENNFFGLISRDVSVTAATLTSDGTRAILCIKINEVSRTAGGNAHISNRNILWIKNLETAQEYDIVCPVNHGYVTAITISLNRKQAICGWQDGHLEIWNLAMRQRQFTLRGHRDEIVAVTIASNGKQAVSSSKDKTLKVWDLETGREISTLNGFNDLVDSIAITPNCKWAISGSRDALLKIWNLEDIYPPVADYATKSLMRVGHSFLPLPTEHYNSNSDKARDFVNLNKIALLILSAAILFVLVYPIFYFILGLDPLASDDILGRAALYTIVFVIFVCCDEGNTKQQSNFLKSFYFLWLIPATFILKIAEISKVIADEDYIQKAYNFLRKILVSIKILQQLDENNNSKQLDNFRDHTDTITSLAATTDGRVISGSNDKTIKVWDLGVEEVRHLFTLNGHRNRISFVAASPNNKNKYLFSGSSDKTLKIWNIESRNEVPHPKPWSGIAYDALLISTYGILAILEIFIIINLDYPNIFSTYLSFFLLFLLSYLYHLVVGLVDRANFDWDSKIVVTPDSKKIISASRDGTIKVWDIETRRQLFTLKGHTDWITSVAVTSNDKYLISGSKDKTLKVWDLETQSNSTTIEVYSSVTAVAITPDGSKAISGSPGGVLKVWALKLGRADRAIATINGHRNAVEAIAVTADGKRFVSAASDCVLKVWNVKTGQKETSFTADSPLTSCVVASEGRIIAGDQAGQLHFLRLENLSALP
jgi:WD40 repeat protein